MKKANKLIKILILCLVFIFNCTYGQNDNSISFSLKNGFSYIDSISINSIKKSDRFILDTGSEFTILNTSFAEKITKKHLKYFDVIDITGKSGKQESIIIDSLKFGNHIYFNVRVVIIDLSFLKLDGVIGNNVLNKHIWSLDYQKNEIKRYSNISELKAIPNNSISFNLGSGVPKINIKIGKVQIRNLIFDTGNANKLSLKATDSILLRKQLVKYSYHSFYGQTFNEKEEKIQHIKSASYSNINIGGYVVDSLNATFTGTRTFGNGLFKNSKIIIDYISSKIYFDHLKPLKSIYLGCWFDITDEGNIRVSSLTKNSIADNYGIKLNDILVSCSNYTNIEFLKQAILDGSFYTFENKEITVKMKSWHSEKKIFLE